MNDGFQNGGPFGMADLSEWRTGTVNLHCCRRLLREIILYPRIPVHIFVSV